MKTIDELRREADALPSPALPELRSKASPFWTSENEDYIRMSDEARARLRHDDYLRYGPDPRHLIDVYAPDEAPEGGAPVFVFFHGGAMVEGHPQLYGFLAEPYVQRGVIFVSAGYRLMDIDAFEVRARAEASGQLVHSIDRSSNNDVAAAQAASAEIAEMECRDARSAVAWVHRHIAAWGGDPNRIVIGGHSSGAMVAVATGCAGDWQGEHGVPDDVVKGIVPVGGRYGLWMANAMINGQPLDQPSREFSPTRLPAARVVFGEEEYDDDDGQHLERAKDCAIIGRQFVAALRAGGADATEVALPPQGHWQTLRSLADEQRATLPVVLDLLGRETVSA